MAAFDQHSQNCSIFASSLHADGVKANHCFETGEIVYREAPLHFLQTLPNRRVTLICGYCSKFLGSVGVQLKYLQKQINREELTTNTADALAKIENHYQHLTDIFPCSGKCGELYCSEYCRDSHWDCKGHKLLCTGHIPDDDAEDHPLFQFKMYAVSTNEIFLMVADIFAEVCANCEVEMAAAKPVDEVAKCYLKRYENFVRKRWWDAVQAPRGQKPIKFKKTLQNLVTECWDLLSSALNLQDRGLDGILDVDFLARTIGMFEQNNVGVRCSNPIVPFLKSLSNSSPCLDCFLSDVVKVADNAEEECCPEFSDEEDSESQAENPVDFQDAETQQEIGLEKTKLEELLNLVEELGEDSLFPPLDGTSFYELTCKINHSCDPNVIVTYATSNEVGLQAQLLVLKPIQADEELVQSYIDQSQSLPARRAALIDYGFICTCRKCQIDASA